MADCESILQSLNALFNSQIGGNNGNMVTTELFNFIKLFTVNVFKQVATMSSQNNDMSSALKHLSDIVIENEKE